MSKIDTGSLDTKKDLDSNYYTDIEEEYDIELFSSDTDEMFRGESTKHLFAYNEEGNQNELAKKQTTNLFQGESFDRLYDVETNEVSKVGIDFSFLIALIVVFGLLFLIFRRMYKNVESR